MKSCKSVRKIILQLRLEFCIWEVERNIWEFEKFLDRKLKILDFWKLENWEFFGNFEIWGIKVDIWKVFGIGNLEILDTWEFEE